MFFKNSIFWLNFSTTITLIVLVILCYLTSEDIEPGNSTNTEPPITQALPEFFKDKKVTSDGIFPLPELSQPLLSSRPSNSDIPPRFYEANIKNKHDFKYSINNPNLCTSDESVYLLVMIASASWEHKRRELIRSTWASFQPIDESKVIKYVFFVGQDTRMSVDETLEEEADFYGDVVKEDFHETYKNLTLKTIGQMKWATHAIFLKESLKF